MLIIVTGFWKAISNCKLKGFRNINKEQPAIFHEGTKIQVCIYFFTNL